MATAEDRGLTKLTVKLYAPMYVDFDKQVGNALLRRDAFLDRVIRQEIGHLREDLEGSRLSGRAHRYISGRLKALGGGKTEALRQVSIAVRHETAEALRAAVRKHNLVRDAFLNRLIALLRASDNLLKALGLRTRVTAWRRNGTEDMPTSPMRVIGETLDDPFYYLRADCLERHGCGLNMLPFPAQLMGMSCYLDDDQVLGTQAYKNREEQEEHLLAELGFIESGLTPTGNRGA